MRRRRRREPRRVEAGSFVSGRVVADGVFVAGCKVCAQEGASEENSFVYLCRFLKMM